MKITIIGTGYVGLVNGVCMAYSGAKVNCIDIDEKKIEDLKNGISPIYEEGLDTMLRSCLSGGWITFSSDYSSVSDSDITFICVGTPQKSDGSANLDYVFGAAKIISRFIKKETVVVLKSTCPVGTTNKIKNIIDTDLVHCAFNPEFLKEGKAISDCLNPDRVVVGIEDGDLYTREVMDELYSEIMEFKNIVYTDIKSAEMVKYASNAMLATRISFINEIANLCEKVGADINSVSKCVGMDTRIGPKFLNAGCGYGGSCFPKDVKALISTAAENGCDMLVLSAVDEANTRQKEVLYKKYKKHQCGKNITILGTAFKPNTDDIREATSSVLINRLLSDGVSITACDPIALGNTRKVFGDRIKYETGPRKAIKDADVVFVVTEWDEFKKITPAELKSLMRGNIVIDGRNIFNKEEMQSAGIVYEHIG
jgi:UDPglucose 6-dehydrogenase